MDNGWIRDAIDTEEAAKLTSYLVSFRSYPGQEGDVQRAISNWLTENGMQAEFQSTEGDRPNVLAYIRNGDGPTFLLNGHVDTVLAAEGWNSDPWQAKRDGDRLYGLGACDMKSGVAAGMFVARALNQHRSDWHGTLVFSSVVDEEAYSIGARALVDAGLKADACVVLEPSGDTPKIGATGKVLVRVDVTGKAAHGFRPQQGINAAVEGAKLVARIDDLPLGQHPRLAPTQCVLSFHGGSQQYVITVPEKASILITRLIVPGETGESVVNEVRMLAEQLKSPARFDLSIEPPYYPPWEISPEHPFIQRFVDAYQAEMNQTPKLVYSTGVADSNLLAADLGIPTVQFGPAGENIHQANEWVNVPSIARAGRVVLRLALDVLS